MVKMKNKEVRENVRRIDEKVWVNKKSSRTIYNWSNNIILIHFSNKNLKLNKKRGTP